MSIKLKQEIFKSFQCNADLSFFATNNVVYGCCIECIMNMALSMRINAPYHDMAAYYFKLITIGVSNLVKYLLLLYSWQTITSARASAVATAVSVKKSLIEMRLTRYSQLFAALYVAEHIRVAMLQEIAHNSLQSEANINTWSIQQQLQNNHTNESQRMASKLLLHKSRTPFKY